MVETECLGIVYFCDVNSKEMLAFCYSDQQPLVGMRRSPASCYLLIRSTDGYFCDQLYRFQVLAHLLSFVLNFLMLFLSFFIKLLMKNNRLT